MPSKEVRDPIHGLIVLEPDEWAVVNTPTFQRLREINQLAMTHLVYPGARHSRFEHCIGACYLAGKLGEQVDLDEEAGHRVRLAALLHDIGHGPYSHVSEEIFESRVGRSHVHESISAAIVREDPDVRGVLGDERAEWIADLLTPQEERQRTVERDIVAGPADVDKLDYLLRDSHFCGVKYGEYDLHKVLETARRAEIKMANETCLAFNAEGVFSLEEMLLARYHMHRQVYGHKTRVATDRMLIRAMELGLEQKILPAGVFSPPANPDGGFIRNYLRLNDESVLRVLLEGGGPAGDVAEALVQRKLMKRVLKWGFADLEERFGQANAGFIIDLRPEQLRGHLRPAEAAIAETIGVEPHWVTLFWQSVQHPLSGRFSFRLMSEDIVITDVNGGGQSSFRSLSEVFSDGELPSQKTISLYARLPDDRSPQGLNAQDRLEIDRAVRDALEGIGTDAAAI